VDPALWEWRGKLWCHLTADSERELHAFAQRLGMRRAWFQHKARAPWQDHYDLTEGKRAQALALGAVELDFDEAGRRYSRRRLLFGVLEDLCDRHQIAVRADQRARDLRAGVGSIAQAAGVDTAVVREALEAMAAEADRRGWWGADPKAETLVLAEVAQRHIAAAA
jgi:2-hydroxychromene-2-carboxylate isomerase